MRTHAPAKKFNDVFDVVNAQIKLVKKELADYRAKHDFCNPANNGNLTPYQCSAKVTALNDLKKALRKEGY